MAARDKHHDAVRSALIADGWTITHDPLYLSVEDIGFSIDLGAEKLIGAERQGRKIAVEVKSFLRASLITDFHQAVGQCNSYQTALDISKMEHELFLAIPYHTFRQLEDSNFYTAAMKRARINLIAVDTDKAIIIKWIE